MAISFIIVNYKSEQFLKNCLLSIQKNITISYEVIIVNNDRDLLESFSDINNLSVLEHGGNNGFANACNVGASNAKGDILFFLNPDTEILTGDILQIITKLKDNTVGAVAPKLITKKNLPQPWSAGYEITLWDIIKNNLGLPKSKVLWNVTEKSEADWISGAAMAISKKTFFACGGFDEKFFMYFEDVDLCKRLRNKNLKIFIVPDFKIMHIGGQSKQNNQQQKEQYYKSQDYYFTKHRALIEGFCLKLLRSLFSN